VRAFLADEFALCEKSAQILADSSFEDDAEALVSFSDLEDHIPSHGLSPQSAKGR